MITWSGRGLQQAPFPVSRMHHPFWLRRWVWLQININEESFLAPTVDRYLRDPVLIFSGRLFWKAQLIFTSGGGTFAAVGKQTISERCLQRIASTECHKVEILPARLVCYTRVPSLVAMATSCLFASATCGGGVLSLRFNATPTTTRATSKTPQTTAIPMTSGFTKP